jgi:argininosuccinate synthase
MKEKIVLAYSGGLDTSVLVHILTHDYGYEVVACHADVGEARDPDKLKARALKSGAVAVEVVDAREEFARDYCFPALQANALYQGVYPLSAALSRPLIAQHLVRVAHAHGATAVAHGATGKGNDQVRFDLAVKGLDPRLKIVAPQRERNISRDQAMAYAEKHGIEISATKKSPFSIDENLWGRSIEGGVLEDPATAPPEEAYAWTRSWKDAPAEPEEITIGFRGGLPSSLNGQLLSPAKLIVAVGEIAGKHGIGRIDLMEDRVVGIKSREVYECPAAITLIAAHADLERFTTLGQCQRVKEALDQRFAEMVYEGFWFSPLRDALMAFNDSVAKTINGDVRLRLFKGSLRAVGRSSPNGLYNHKLATYGVDDQFDHRAAEGFINLLGLPLSLFSRQKGAL